MQQQGSSNSPGNEAFHEKVRGKLKETLALALPVALINAVVELIKSGFFSQPWQILLFAVPLGGLAYFAWRRVPVDPSAKIGKWYLILFGSYVLIFSLAANAGLLDWKRSLQGYNQAVPRNFLSLNWLGDWRYWVVPENEPAQDFALVFMPVGETIEVGRVHAAQLIQLAVASGVKGVAFDFHFRDNSHPEVDKRLCKEITEAESKAPVLVGHGFEWQGEITFKGVAPSLRDCIPESRQGHTVAYTEFDNAIRHVPLYFRNDPNRESLALKVARELKQDVQLPSSGLVQFVKPASDFPEIEFDELFRQQARLKDRFLLVGERNPTDTWPTPYGALPGVVIHAYVVHSLRHNQFFQRVPWWSSFLLVFASCYLVTLLFAQGWRKRKIALVMILVSVAIWLLSLLAVVFWMIWLDVIYVLLAMWLLFVLLIGLSKARDALKRSRSNDAVA